MNVATLTAKVAVDPRDLDAGLKKAQAAMGRFSDGAERVGKVVEQALGVQTDKAVASAVQVFAHLHRGAVASTQAVVTGLHHTERAAKAANVAFGHLRATSTRAFAGMTSGAKTASAALQTLGTGGLVTAAAGVAAVSAAFASLGKRGVDVNLQLQGAEKTFATLFRSTTVASDFMNALRKESLSSAFEFTDLAGFSESLAAFGFEAKNIIPTIRVLGDTARGNAEKLQRLVLAFGQIRAKGVLQGEEALQLTEAGIPVRDLLKMPKGTDFGDAKLSADVAIPQLLGGLNAMFGGLQQQATRTLPGIWSNISDALNEITSKATQKLLTGLTKAAGSLLDTLNQVANSGLAKSLAVPFDIAGKAIEGIAAKLPAIAKWMETAFNADGLKIFFSNTMGLLKTLGEEFAQFFGVDLAKLTDPKNVNRFFEAISDGVFNGINALFGLGRVWDELRTIIAGWAVDAGDLLKDWAEDVGRTITGMFVGLEVSINTFQASLMGAFASMADGINRLIESLNNNWLFRLLNGSNALGKIDVSGLYDAQQEAAGRAGSAVWRAADLAQQQRDAEQARAEREQRKRAADPFRGDSFGQRIGDAFSGRGRDTAAQDDFWKRFERNKLEVGRFFFGGSEAPPMPAFPVPQLAMGRYPDERRPRTGVFDSASGEGGVFRPQVPTSAAAAAFSYTPPQFDPRDPYRGVTLANGEQSTAFVAGQRGLPFTEQQYASPGAGLPAGAGALGVSSGGPVTNYWNIPITVAPDASRAEYDAAADRAWEVFQENRQRERRQSGSLAPSRGFAP